MLIPITVQLFCEIIFCSGDNLVTRGQQRPLKKKKRHIRTERWHRCRF